MIVFVLILPLISSESVITGDTVTGEAITGEASQQFSMQIYAQLTIPYLKINSPLNYTYRNNTVFIDYISDNEDFIWYNFDGGTNFSLTGAINITGSEGAHVLNLFANNSNGEKHVSSFFTVNSSKIIIIYDEFKEKGDTSNFDSLIYDFLNSVNNVVLENPDYGKIEFIEAVNFLEHLSGEENIVDLDGNIDISANSISLDSSTITGFNKSAKLYLYNIEYENPRILKDGVFCPVSLCQIQSYSNNILEFNVNSFSTYSAEETPEGTGTGTGTGTGGGGTGTAGSYGQSEPIPKQEPEIFTINKDTINVKLKQGETKKESFEIMNQGNETFYFMINPIKTENFLKISNRTFELAPGERIEILLDFIARENILPDLYLGKLIIETQNQQKEILIVMEVESDKSLFDIRTEIDRRYRSIRRGEEVVAKIELFNLGGVDRVDVMMEYIIKDAEGNELLREHEMLAIETKISFLKEFQMPYSLGEGDYALYTRVVYEGEVASSSAWFSIVSKKSINWALASLYVFLLFIVFSIIRLYQLYVKEKRGERVRKYEEDEERDERSKTKSLATSASEKVSERKKKGLDKKKQELKNKSEGKYIKIKPLARKKIVRKVVKKKVNRKLTPSGYLDLTKALKDKK